MILNKISNTILLFLSVFMLLGCQGRDFNTSIQSTANTSPTVLATDQTSTQHTFLTLEEINGWNHVSFYPDEYNDLAQLSGAYHVKATEVIHNSQRHLEVETVLVRKLSHAFNQNSNGIILSLEDRNLTIGQLNNLSLTLAINGRNSVIPTPFEASHYYNQYIRDGIISQDWLNELLEEPAVLTFTLMSKGVDDIKATAAGYYRYYVSAIDEKVQLSLSANDFIDGSITDELSKLDQTITAIVITLDTATNQTLEDFIALPSTTIKELYLEADISITDISLSYRQIGLLAKY